MRSENFYISVEKRSFFDNDEFYEEIKEYIHGRESGKDTTSIYSDLGEDGKRFDKQILVVIFELYLESTLGEWDLEYLLNWIEMSGYEFPEDIHEKAIFPFSTPEINYPINKLNIKEAISFLNGEISQPNYLGKNENKLYRSKIII